MVDREIVQRPATAEDAPSLARVHTQAWRETYEGLVPNDFIKSFSLRQREAMWAKVIPDLKAQGQSLQVLTHRNQLVAFSHCGSARGGGAREGELYALYVLKSHQKRGLGKLLIDDCRFTLRSLGHRSMIVWVLDENPARAFYKAMGGIEGESKQSKHGPHALTECSYAFELEPPIP